jgi:general L-amino acid transport system ATP-binding protein
MTGSIDPIGREETAIDMIGVHKWYGEFHVLREINLRVMRGERIVVCGPSGSGKSTLIRCINRLEEHQRGKIVVNGTELTANLRHIERVRQDVGMVFQQFNLFPHLTVLENCTLAPIQVRGASRKPTKSPCIFSIAFAFQSRQTSIRLSSPAASSSASPLRARSA